MKNLFFLQFFILYVSITFAQQSGEIIYKKIYSKWDKERIETLYVDNQQSVYIEKAEGERFWTPENYRVTLAQLDQKWYLDQETLEVVEQKKNFKKDRYELMQYKTRPYDWTIHDEHKTIGEYKVQKATTIDPDPDYGEVTAWFTTAIPISSGPHRLWGLPGLIIEAEFSDNPSVYRFESIEYKAVDHLKPTEGKWVKAEVNASANRQKLQDALNQEGN
jgi:GLPGLI family protein